MFCGGLEHENQKGHPLPVGLLAQRNQQGEVMFLFVNSHEEFPSLSASTWFKEKGSSSGAGEHRFGHSRGRSDSVPQNLVGWNGSSHSGVEEAPSSYRRVLRRLRNTRPPA